MGPYYVQPKVRRRRVASGALLALAGLSAAGAVVVSTCTLCYAVSADGTSLAYVQGEGAYRLAVQQVEEAVSAVLDRDYTYDGGAVTSLAIVPKEKVSSPALLSAKLMDTVEEVKGEYVLSVDGVAVGACQSRDAIDQALWQVKATFATRDTVAVYFDSSVDVSYTYLPAQAEVVDAFTLANRLIQGEEESETPAQTPEEETDESQAALPVFVPLVSEEEKAEAAQEDPSPDEAPAQEETTPLLEVMTVEEVTYTVAIPAPVEEVEDDTLLLGQRVTRQEGTDGQEEITDRVVRCRGEEQNRETLSSQVLTEPTPTVVAVGTAQGVEGAKGRFQWPVTGTITSSFGQRTIFGSTSFHSGTDLAQTAGTPIAAGADGVVIWAGAMGSYGNLVKIDHQNGFVTYYGHCSEILVQEGDVVTQGQTIALVGSTGRSTGPHCHYEIRWQGEALNPEECLS